MLNVNKETSNINQRMLNVKRQYTIYVLYC